MTSLKIRRIVTAACTVGAVAVFPMVTAAPAHAAARHCQEYLKPWYVVGPNVKAACKQGETLSGVVFCVEKLKAIHVAPALAGEACNRAYSY